MAPHFRNTISHIPNSSRLGISHTLIILFRKVLVTFNAKLKIITNFLRRANGRELKHEYEYHLILDKSISHGTVDRVGPGLTELHNVTVGVSIISPCTPPHVVQAMQIDVFVGSVADSA